MKRNVSFLSFAIAAIAVFFVYLPACANDETPLPDFKNWVMKGSASMNFPGVGEVRGTVYTDNADQEKADNIITETRTIEDDKLLGAQWMQIVLRDGEGKPVTVRVRMYIFNGTSLKLIMSQDITINPSPEATK